MATETISLSAVYSRIKGVIAGIKSIPRGQILADNTLRDDLGFTNVGVRALAVPISDAFGDIRVSVSRDEMEETETVRDVSKLVFRKIPGNR